MSASSVTFKTANPYVKLERLNVIFDARITLEHIKIFSCSKCNSIFHKIEHLKIHKLAHIRESVEKAKQSTVYDKKFIKRYSCDKCDARFVQESTLAAHLFIHEPFPHVCHCGVGFYDKYVLQQHKRLVHPVEPPPPKQIITNKVNGIKNNVKTSMDASLTPLIQKAKLPVKPKLKAELKYNLDIKKTNDRRFKCPMCTKHFSCKRNVVIHLRTHTGERPYSCNICGKQFTQSGALKVHLKRHTGIKEFSCNHCGKEFYDKAATELHERTHTGVKPYVCPYCNKAFSDKSAINRHIRTHTGVKPYSCSICSMEFSDASGLIAHKKRHIGIKAFSCDICTYKCMSGSELKRHVLTVHAKIKTFKCIECNAMFSAKNNMLNHYQRAHQGDKNLECNDCGRKFMFKSNLIQHIVKCHSKKVYCKKCFKPFLGKTMLKEHKARGCTRLQCEECKMIFKTRTLLEKHSLSHLDNTVHNLCYECDHCGLTFKLKRRLYDHIISRHFNVSKCQRCKERFISNYLYQQHVKICASKKYVCDLCQMTYRYKRSLKTHLLCRHYAIRNEG